MTGSDHDTVELLELALSGARAGVWAWQIESGEVRWSSDLERIHGLEPGAFGGRIEQVLEEIHPDDLEHVQAAIRRALEDGDPYTVSYRIIRPDGRLAWLEANGRVRRDAQDRPVSMAGVCMDVSDRKRLEQAQLATETRYRLMVQMAPHGIALLNLAGVVIDVNPAVERLLGRARDEILGHGCWPFTHPADHEREQPLLEAVLRGESDGYTIEKRYVRKDGSSIWANLALTLIRGEGGSPNCLLALIEDINARKQARIALEESEARLRLVSSQLPALVWSTDRELRITSVSGVLNREVMQPTYGDITGTELGSRDDTPDEFYDAHLRVVASGEPETFDLQWLGRAMETRIEPLVSDGMIVGTVGLGIDRTEQRELERLMQQAAQLQALGQLARGIAHDFNNLLASIRISSDLGLEHAQDESARREFEIVRDAVTQGAGMVSQLQAFGRQQPVQARPIDLDELLEQSQPVLARLLSERPITLTQRRGGDERVIVTADGSQLNQLVFNLVLNARDAIAGEGQITLETGTADLDFAHAHKLEVEPGRYGKLLVSDTGAGMDPETMARVFEPFFTTKPEGKGTGLGLATVYGIVSQWGGAVELASEQGVGSIFTVLLPLAETPADGSAKRDVPTTPAQERPVILLVEDEPRVRVQAARLLERRGYPYFVAENGEAALAVVAAQPIDLLLTDVRMPKLGGGDLARRLRRSNPQLPVILMSGDIRDEADLQGLDNGRTAFLAKPFTVTELERTITALMEPTALLGR